MGIMLLDRSCPKCQLPTQRYDWPWIRLFASQSQKMRWYGWWNETVEALDECFPYRAVRNWVVHFIILKISRFTRPSRTCYPVDVERTSRFLRFRLFWWNGYHILFDIKSKESCMTDKTICILPETDKDKPEISRHSRGPYLGKDAMEISRFSGQEFSAGWSS